LGRGLLSVCRQQWLSQLTFMRNMEGHWQVSTRCRGLWVWEREGARSGRGQIGEECVVGEGGAAGRVQAAAVSTVELYE
jgi:hypothetical protein